MNDKADDKPSWFKRALTRWRRPRTAIKPQSSVDAQSKVHPRGRYVRRLAIALAVLIVLFTVVGFFVVPPIAKHLLVTELSAKLHRQVGIGDIAVNPFSMTVSVKNLVIHERNSRTEFVAFDELFVNLQLESVFRRAPILREIRLQGPRVNVIRLDERTFNFSDLLTTFAGKPDGKATSKNETARFSLNNIQILNGKVTLDDRVKNTKHTLSQFTLAVPFIANLDYLVDNPVQPALSGVLNGAGFALKGTTKPFKTTLETTLNLDFDGVNLPPYLEYLPVALNFKVDSAKLATRIALSFARAGAGEPLLRLSGRIALTEVDLSTSDRQPILQFPALEIEIAESQPLKQQATIASITLRKPSLHVRRFKDGSLSLIKAFVPDGSDSAQREPGLERSRAEPAFKLSLAEFRLDGGRIHFIDEGPAQPFSVDLDPVEFTLRNLALPQQNPAQADLSVRSSIGASFVHSGAFLMDPLVAQGTIMLNNVALNKFANYYADEVLVDIMDGEINIATRYETSKHSGVFDSKLTDLETILSKFRVNKRGAKNSFFQIGKFAVKGATLNLAQRSVSLGNVQISDGRLSLLRDKKGVLDVTQIARGANAAQGARPASAPSVESPPWTWTVNAFSLDAFKLGFQDDFPNLPVAHGIDLIKVRGDNLTNRAQSKGRFSVNLGVNKTGKVAIQGSLGLNPLGAAFDLDIRNIDLVPLQPYFTERINILISSAAANIKGAASYATASGQSGRGAFRGDFAIVNLASVDKVASEDFLKWKSLSVSGIRAESNPFSLQVADVALTNFYSRLIIHPDGHLNVQDIAVKSQDPEAKESAAPSLTSTQSEPNTASQAATAITIGKVTLQGGNINFSDRFIQPNYSANLTDLAGSVSGMSSQLGTTAALELRGSLDNTAPLEIAGRLNPLIGNLFLDLKAQIKDIELGPMSAYSGKYVGYAIEKGKLSFDVKYFIENRKLQAENRLIVDQLTFGDKVESKDALSLPVKFAVSLLKDKDGVIDVNLPISGSLDDPKFSVGGLIWKVIVNLFQKAVTAPFALIGSMFGGGPELSQIDFDVGSNALSKESEDRLGKLAKALTDRPALKLDITGRASPAVDREGLRKLRFDRQVKAEKLKDLVKRGESVTSLDQIKVEQNEYQKYLTRAYKGAKFPKPRNVVGFVKDLPVREMEKLMLTNVQISDDDLMKLATERAQSAKDYLTKAAKVQTERVFLAAPKVGAEAEDNGKATRAEFTLK